MQICQDNLFKGQRWKYNKLKNELQIRFQLILYLLLMILFSCIFIINYMGKILSSLMLPTSPNFSLPFIIQKSNWLASSLPFSDLLPTALKLPSSTSTLPQSYILPHCLTLLTYNVWFQQHNMPIRYNQLIRIILSSNADIICLQEVNAQFLNLVSIYATTYSRPLYKMHWYDTLILSKYPCTFYSQPFPQSGMSRRMLCAAFTFEHKGKPLNALIHSVHLQSLNSQEARMQQLDFIKRISQRADIVIVAGDFNFSDGARENERIMQYQDVWKVGKIHGRQRENGFTMLGSGRYPPWRPDHVIVKNNLAVGNHQIGIVGDYTVQPYQKESPFITDEVIRTPSDHYGLMAIIGLK